LHAELVDPASEGTLTFNSDGSFTFFKDTAGAVTFTYMACDDADFCSVVATVTINVQSKPGKVSFAQERNTVNPFGAVGTWSQPFWKGDGSFYTGPGNAVPGPPGAWTYPYAAPTWATSYVTVWGAGQVCNSGQTNVDAGTLYAYLRGTKGTPYTISAQIDVQVSATWPATTDPVQMNNPYASATIKDHTGSYTPSQLGSIRTHTPADPETTSSSESFSMAVTLTATGNGVLKVKLLEIRPTLVGNDEALAGAQAYFTATIYVSAITP
jgi:hypothetical protein